MSLFKRGRKIVCLFTAFCFVVTSGVGLPTGTSSLWAASVPSPALAFAIPNELGNIEEIFAPDLNQIDQPQIIHIQDAHVNYDAQKSISGLLEFLASKKDGLFGTVLLEGVFGEIDTSIFQAIPNQKLKENGVEWLLKRGLISGPEYFQAVSSVGDKVVLKGIESKESYRKNYEAFSKVGKMRVETEKEFQLVKKYLQNIKSRIYPKRLRWLDKYRDRFRDGNISLLDYVQKIISFSKNKMDWDEIPQIAKLLKIQKKKRFSSEEIRRFQQTLDGNQLFSEIYQLEKTVRSGYLKTNAEKQLDQYLFQMEMFERGLNLELTPSEVDFIRQKKNQLDIAKIKRFVEEQTENEKDKEWLVESKLAQATEEILNFYYWAEVRDQQLFDNIQRKIQKQKSKRVIVITGGYHTRGLSGLFRENNLSFVIVAPRIKKVAAEETHKLYLKNMGEWKFLENTLAILKAFDVGDEANQLIPLESRAKAALKRLEFIYRRPLTEGDFEVIEKKALELISDTSEAADKIHFLRAVKTQAGFDNAVLSEEEIDMLAGSSSLGVLTLSEDYVKTLAQITLAKVTSGVRRDKAERVAKLSGVQDHEKMTEALQVISEKGYKGVAPGDVIAMKVLSKLLIVWENIRQSDEYKGRWEKRILAATRGGEKRIKENISLWLRNNFGNRIATEAFLDYFENPGEVPVQIKTLSGFLDMFRARVSESVFERYKAVFEKVFNKVYVRKSSVNLSDVFKPEESADFSESINNNSLFLLANLMDIHMVAVSSLKPDWDPKISQAIISELKDSPEKVRFLLASSLGEQVQPILPQGEGSKNTVIFKPKQPFQILMGDGMTVLGSFLVLAGNFVRVTPEGKLKTTRDGRYRGAVTLNTGRIDFYEVEYDLVDDEIRIENLQSEKLFLKNISLDDLIESSLSLGELGSEVDFFDRVPEAERVPLEREMREAVLLDRGSFRSEYNKILSLPRRGDAAVTKKDLEQFVVSYLRSKSDFFPVSSIYFGEFYEVAPDRNWFPKSGVEVLIGQILGGDTLQPAITNELLDVFDKVLPAVNLVLRNADKIEMSIADITDFLTAHQYTNSQKIVEIGVRATEIIENNGLLDKPASSLGLSENDKELVVEAYRQLTEEGARKRRGKVLRTGLGLIAIVAIITTILFSGASIYSNVKEPTLLTTKDAIPTRAPPDKEVEKADESAVVDLVKERNLKYRQRTLEHKKKIVELIRNLRLDQQAKVDRSFGFPVFDKQGFRELHRHTAGELQQMLAADMDSLLAGIEKTVNKHIEDYNKKHPTSKPYPELSRKIFYQAAEKQKIPVDLLLAFLFQETNDFNPQARSGPDGRGLVQITPLTLKEYWKQAQEAGIVPKDKTYDQIKRANGINRILYDPNVNVQLAAIIIRNYSDRINLTLDRLSGDRKVLSPQKESQDRLKFTVLSYSRGITRITRLLEAAAKQGLNYWDYDAVMGLDAGQDVNESILASVYGDTKTGRRRLLIGLNYVSLIFGGPVYKLEKISGFGGRKYRLISVEPKVVGYHQLLKQISQKPKPLVELAEKSGGSLGAKDERLNFPLMLRAKLFFSKKMDENLTGDVSNLIAGNSRYSSSGNLKKVIERLQGIEIEMHQDIGFLVGLFSKEPEVFSEQNMQLVLDMFQRSTSEDDKRLALMLIPFFAEADSRYASQSILNLILSTPWNKSRTVLDMAFLVIPKLVEINPSLNLPSVKRAVAEKFERESGRPRIPSFFYRKVSKMFPPEKETYTDTETTAFDLNEGLNRIEMGLLLDIGFDPVVNLDRPLSTEDENQDEDFWTVPAKVLKYDPVIFKNIFGPQSLEDSIFHFLVQNGEPVGIFRDFFNSADVVYFLPLRDPAWYLKHRTIDKIAEQFGKNVYFFDLEVDGDHENAGKSDMVSYMKMLTEPTHRRGFVVYPHVYFSEKNVSRLKNYFNGKLNPGDRVWDVGAGTGINSLLATKRGAVVVASDVNLLAVRNAERNRDLWGVNQNDGEYVGGESDEFFRLWEEDEVDDARDLLREINERVRGIVKKEPRMDVRYGDLFEVVQPDEKFDLVVFSAPVSTPAPLVATSFVSMALTDFNTQLLTRFINGLPGVLTPNGKALVMLPEKEDSSKLTKVVKEAGLDLKVVAGKNLYEISFPEASSLGKVRTVGAGGELQPIKPIQTASESGLKFLRVLASQLQKGRLEGEALSIYLALSENLEDRLPAVDLGEAQEWVDDEIGILKTTDPYKGLSEQDKNLLDRAIEDEKKYQLTVKYAEAIKALRLNARENYSVESLARRLNLNSQQFSRIYEFLKTNDSRFAAQTAELRAKRDELTSAEKGILQFYEEYDLNGYFPFRPAVTSNGQLANFVSILPYPESFSVNSADRVDVATTNLVKQRQALNAYGKQARPHSSDGSLGQEGQDFVIEITDPADRKKWKERTGRLNRKYGQDPGKTFEDEKDRVAENLVAGFKRLNWNFEGGAALARMATNPFAFKSAMKILDAVQQYPEEMEEISNEINDVAGEADGLGRNYFYEYFDRNIKGQFLSSFQLERIWESEKLPLKLKVYASLANIQDASGLPDGMDVFRFLDNAVLEESEKRESIRKAIEGSNKSYSEIVEWALRNTYPYAKGLRLFHGSLNFKNLREDDIVLEESIGVVLNDNKFFTHDQQRALDYAGGETDAVVGIEVPIEKISDFSFIFPGQDLGLNEYVLRVGIYQPITDIQKATLRLRSERFDFPENAASLGQSPDSQKPVRQVTGKMIKRGDQAPDQPIFKLDATQKTRPGIKRIIQVLKERPSFSENYEILEGAKWEQGGFAEIIKAYHKGLGRDVAVKVQPVGEDVLEDTEGYREKLSREAKIHKNLSHPNIVKLIDHDLFEVEGFGEYEFIVLDYIDGISLEEFIKNAKNANMKIPPPLIVKVASQIASAINYLAEQGIVHRDIKPGNIMMTSRGHVKLIDLGSAVFEGEPEDKDTFEGSPAYMSIEQARGDGLDVRADLYSLGVVLYEMVMGERPYSGTLTEIFNKVVRQERKPIKASTPLFDEIISKLLQPDKTQRYISVDHLHKDLKRLQRAGRFKAWLNYAGVFFVFGVLSSGLLLNYRSAKLKKKFEDVEMFRNNYGFKQALVLYEKIGKSYWEQWNSPEKKIALFLTEKDELKEPRAQELQRQLFKTDWEGTANFYIALRYQYQDKNNEMALKYYRLFLENQDKYPQILNRHIRQAEDAISEIEATLDSETRKKSRLDALEEDLVSSSLGKQSSFSDFYNANKSAQRVFSTLSGVNEIWIVLPVNVGREMLVKSLPLLVAGLFETASDLKTVKIVTDKPGFSPSINVRGSVEAVSFEDVNDGMGNLGSESLVVSYPKKINQRIQADLNNARILTNFGRAERFQRLMSYFENLELAPFDRQQDIYVGFGLKMPSEDSEMYRQLEESYKDRRTANTAKEDPFDWVEDAFEVWWASIADQLETRSFEKKSIKRTYGALAGLVNKYGISRSDRPQATEILFNLFYPTFLDEPVNFINQLEGATQFGILLGGQHKSGKPVPGTFAFGRHILKSQTPFALLKRFYDYIETASAYVTGELSKKIETHPFYFIYDTLLERQSLFEELIEAVKDPKMTPEEFWDQVLDPSKEWILYESQPVSIDQGDGVPLLGAREQNRIFYEKAQTAAERIVQELIVGRYLDDSKLLDDQTEREWLERHLRSVISNSVDAIRSKYQSDIQKGLIKFRVILRNGRLWFQTIDNGDGIPEELFSRLGEERIYSSKLSSSDNGYLGGMGVGLAQAARDYEKLGWSFSFKNQESPATGAIVSIVIPQRNLSLGVMVADKIEVPSTQLTEAEIRKYFGEDILRSSRELNRTFHIRSLDPEMDAKFIDAWREEFSQDEESQKKWGKRLGGTLPAFNSPLPYFGYLEKDGAFALISKIGGEEKLEGYMRAELIPVDIDFENPRSSYEAIFPQMELYYRNIGSEAKLPGVADLLFDFFIKSAIESNGDIDSISFNAVTPGSKSFARRRGMIFEDGSNRCNLSRDRMQVDYETRMLKDSFVSPQFAGSLGMERWSADPAVNEILLGIIMEAERLSGKKYDRSTDFFLAVGHASGIEDALRDGKPLYREVLLEGWQDWLLDEGKQGIEGVEETILSTEEMYKEKGFTSEENEVWIGRYVAREMGKIFIPGIDGGFAEYLKTLVFGGSDLTLINKKYEEEWRNWFKSEGRTKKLHDLNQSLGMEKFDDAVIKEEIGKLGRIIDGVIDQLDAEGIYNKEERRFSISAGPLSDEDLDKIGSLPDKLQPILLAINEIKKKGESDLNLKMVFNRVRTGDKLRYFDVAGALQPLFLQSFLLVESVLGEKNAQVFEGRLSHLLDLSENFIRYAASQKKTKAYHSEISGGIRVFPVIRDWEAYPAKEDNDDEKMAMVYEKKMLAEMVGESPGKEIAAVKDTLLPIFMALDGESLVKKFEFNQGVFTSLDEFLRWLEFIALSFDFQSNLSASQQEALKSLRGVISELKGVEESGVTMNSLEEENRIKSDVEKIYTEELFLESGKMIENVSATKRIKDLLFDLHKIFAKNYQQDFRNALDQKSSAALWEFFNGIIPFAVTSKQKWETLPPYKEPGENRYSHISKISRALDKMSARDSAVFLDEILSGSELSFNPELFFDLYEKNIVGEKMAELFFLAVILHDYGTLAAKDHYDIGAVLVEDLLKNLGYDSHEIQIIKEFVRHHAKPFDFYLRPTQQTKQGLFQEMQKVKQEVFPDDPKGFDGFLEMLTLFALFDVNFAGNRHLTDEFVPPLQDEEADFSVILQQPRFQKVNIAELMKFPEIIRQGIEGQSLGRRPFISLIVPSIELTDEEVRKYFGVQALQRAKRLGQTFYLRRLNPEEDDRFISEWAFEIDEDEAWQQMQMSREEPFELPHFSTVGEGAFGLISKIGTTEKLEGYVDFEVSPDPAFEKPHYSLSLYQMELYYRNIGATVELPNVADLLFDFLIKMVVESGLTIDEISFYAATPGSVSFANRRNMDRPFNLERALTDEEFEKNYEDLGLKQLFTNLAANSSLGAAAVYDDFISRNVLEDPFSVIVIDADLLAEEVVLNGLIDRLNRNSKEIVQAMWNSEGLNAAQVNKVKIRIQNSIAVNPERFQVIDMREEINPSVGMKKMLEGRQISKLLTLAKRFNSEIQTESDLMKYIAVLADSDTFSRMPKQNIKIIEYPKDQIAGSAEREMLDLKMVVLASQLAALKGDLEALHKQFPDTFKREGDLFKFTDVLLSKLAELVQAFKAAQKRAVAA